MSDGVVAIVVVGVLFIGLPGMILHYITEWRKTKSPTVDDERLVDDLWRTAQRLERRVETLERILDKEAPEWRKSKDEAEFGSRGPGPGASYRGGGNA